MAGIYLHIPFCKRRCIYCDFFSTTQSEMKETYIQALCKELELRSHYLKGDTVETIYLGGGTPSQLNAKDFEHIFNALYKFFPISKQAEITLEANPDDLTTQYLADLHHLPFNRLSMGIQTFHDNILRQLHRRHTAQQAIEAFLRCREAGFDNLSIDLMYGLPGESLALWEADLEQAISLRPEHLSAYHLIYEEGTPLWNLREQHDIEETDEELSLKLFTTLIDRLTAAGYEHYEISNFALPHRESRHNSSYWEGIPYLGCGPSAHSYNGNSRQWNIASLDRYLKGIKHLALDFEIEELDRYTRYNDFIITRMRTKKGLPLPLLKTEFGEDLYGYFLKMAMPYLQQGKIEKTGEVIRLTRSGIFVSDGIMSDLLWAD